jgi:hypothetical protein
VLAERVQGGKMSAICDNTDCKGKSKIFYHCKIAEEFEGGTCTWCEDCLNDDGDMIEEYKLLEVK